MSESQEKQESNKPTIVAVDDERYVLDFYQAALQEMCKVELFETAPEALNFMFKNQVALAIIDRKLPHMSGDDLCQRLREDPRTKLLPIIIVSGLKDIDDIAEMMPQKGIETYLTKPISPRRLRAHVKFYLRESRN